MFALREIVVFRSWGTPGYEASEGKMGRIVGKLDNYTIQGGGKIYGWEVEWVGSDKRSPTSVIRPQNLERPTMEPCRGDDMDRLVTWEYVFETTGYQRRREDLT